MKKEKSKQNSIVDKEVYEKPLSKEIEGILESLWYIHSDDIRSMKNYYEDFEARLLTDKVEIRETIQEVLLLKDKQFAEAVKKLKEEIPNEVIDPETNTELYVWEEIDKIMGFTESLGKNQDRIALSQADRKILKEVGN